VLRTHSGRRVIILGRDLRGYSLRTSLIAADSDMLDERSPPSVVSLECRRIASRGVEPAGRTMSSWGRGATKDAVRSLFRRSGGLPL